MIATATRLSVYFGDAVASGRGLAGDALMAHFARHRLPAAALLRGIEGFGLNRRVHAERFPDVSTDLPLLGVAVGERAAMAPVVAGVDELLSRGLVTTEDVRLFTGRDVAEADHAGEHGDDLRLTVYCSGDRGRRRPAYREVVAALRRRGAQGAIVLQAVDAVAGERRRRITLGSRSARASRVVVSVGPAAPLLGCLRDLEAVMAEPVATIESVRVLKHDGRALRAPPLGSSPAAGAAGWQAISVLTRRTARVDGRPVSSELTRRLREEGGAGATTVLGDWGYSSDEHPHGDRLGRVASHRPTITITVDEPARLAAAWRAIDGVTSRHGLVVSSGVSGYREHGGAPAR